MLIKLSLSGAKKQSRDYLVLFSGLVIAAAIFYMFQTLATNKDFLESNSTISMITFIFQLGAVLLSIITMVYLLYANSFLMSMRQRDYAMFMMLGAHIFKIAQLIFIETLAVGILASLVGSALGIGLTTVVNSLLTKQLDIQVTHFSPFSQKAVLVTLLFFAFLFLLSAIVNARSIVKKPILTLLNADKTPNRLKRKPIALLVETIMGVILLAIGYFMMDHLAPFGFLALVIALVTIVLGTYLVFHAVLIFLLDLCKRSDKLVLKKLNNFTLSQLSFRIQDYTKMLAMVAMIFALALGAMTVGIGFRNQIPKLTEQTTTYDLTLNNAQAIDQKQVAALKPTLNVTYPLKEDAATIYFEQTAFDQEPLLALDSLGKKVTYTGDQMKEDSAKTDALRALLLPDQQVKELQILDKAQFSALEASETSLQVVQVKDFLAAKKELKALVDENNANNPYEDKYGFVLTQKYDFYVVFNEMFSGLEFMGFFLGLAFLAMLASCLMFKILSGAPADITRYEMLSKIGARQSLLKASLRKELAVLFLVPGLLGMIHVLFGLKMFTSLLSEPYAGIWLPFSIFFVLYFIYYLLTVWLYSGIVLKKTS